MLAPLDDTPVWSIVCFVVGRAHRGQGVADRLLAGAIDYAKARGATTLEAYPVEIPEGERVASANVFKGTLSMFERHGFEVVARPPGHRERRRSTRSSVWRSERAGRGVRSRVLVRRVLIPRPMSTPGLQVHESNDGSL